MARQSFPALLVFAYKYADSFEAAVLANANAGGENVARGSLLGALLGAAHGTSRLFFF
jgi:ADP-ribosyl-[dinitrogen reductase] hydrolase